MSALSPELFYTALAAAFTGLLWVPIILNRLAEMGLVPALKNPEPDARPKAAWANRMAAAHRNALENLAVFAPLALIVDAAGLGDGLTAGAAGVYLAARIAHAVIYAFGIPLLRTLAFFTGFLCQMALAARILGYL